MERKLQEPYRSELLEVLDIEGFEYGLIHKSDWEWIPNEKFQKLLANYKKHRTALKTFLDKE